MTAKQKATIKAEHYNEALRYMDNAKETLKKAGKERGQYQDDKYVKTACGTAYNGVLKALDGYLLIKGTEMPKGRRKTIEYYKTNITKYDKFMTKNLHDAYEVLHLSGYYDGLCNENIIKSGFDVAYAIIDKIKPTAAELNGLK